MWSNPKATTITARGLVETPLTSDYGHGGYGAYGQEGSTGSMLASPLTSPFTKPLTKPLTKHQKQCADEHQDEDAWPSSHAPAAGDASAPRAHMPLAFTTVNHVTTVNDVTGWLQDNVHRHLDGITHLSPPSRLH